MTTPEQIAAFIEESPWRVNREGRRVKSVCLKDNFFIEEFDEENVLFGQEGDEGAVEINVALLRSLSPAFDTVCQCPDCKDTGSYEVLTGPESRWYECDCDTLPFGIGYNAKK
jgi:hypothetical protein